MSDVEKLDKNLRIWWLCSALKILYMYLTLVLLKFLWVFFIHLKLKVLKQFPASNEWKIIFKFKKKNGSLPNWIILSTANLPQNMLQILVVFY